MKDYSGLPIPITAGAVVQYWIWFRMSRLVAVYDVWPLPGAVHVSEENRFSTNQTPEFLAFFARFLSCDLARLASTGGLPFVDRARRCAVDEKIVHMLAQIGTDCAIEPPHCSVATYASEVGLWMLRQLPSEDEWPSELIEWTDAVKKFFFREDLPMNPWMDTWLDLPATNATDFDAFTGAVKGPKLSGYGVLKPNRLNEVDPNQEPPDIYGYLAAVAVVGSSLTPPPSPTQQDSSGKPLIDKNWLRQLCSVVDNL